MARLYAELTRNFPREGVRVCTVATGGGVNTEGAQTAIPGVEVQRMPFTFREARRAASVIRWARWSAREVRTGRVSLLHVGNIRPAGYVAAWLNLRLRVPYLIYVHGADLYRERRKCRESRAKRFTSRLIFGRADAIVANSRHTATMARELLTQLGIEDRGRVRVVHPGTDPGRFLPRSDQDPCALLGLDPGAGPVVLSVGRLVSRKGFDTALEAVARLAPRYPGLVYLIAGTGPDRGRLGRNAESLGIASRVRFLEDVRENALPGLYAGSDIFVMLAREEPEVEEIEGFGIVYCEASAAGLPVVAADSGGVADAVRHGVNGFLVPPRDPVAAAAALASLIDDPALRRAMGRTGRLLVEEYYNWDRAAREVWDISRALARPCSRSR
jgi:phosphatidylinositol alpha-1,6-mannosyltransferase